MLLPVLLGDLALSLLDFLLEEPDLLLHFLGVTLIQLVQLDIELSWGDELWSVVGELWYRDRFVLREKRSRAVHHLHARV